MELKNLKGLLNLDINVTLWGKNKNIFYISEFKRNDIKKRKKVKANNLTLKNKAIRFVLSESLKIIGLVDYCY